jgi:peptidyl-dipeptidase Dcp
VPPWDKVDPEAFPAALGQAMDDQRERSRRIAADPAPPTFANTIVALERSGRVLDRVETLFKVHADTLKDGRMARIEQEVRPRLAALSDEIAQDPALFRRIEAVYAGRGRLGPEQQRLVWLYHTRFVRAGARLAPGDKARVTAINQRLAGLYARFGQNVLEDETSQCTVVEREADLTGLSPEYRAGAAHAAEVRGLSGRWVVANTRSAVEPFLEFAEDRALREQVWKTFMARGDLDGPTCNRGLVTEILDLRRERARLLGYPTYAHWALKQTMAGTPERARALLESVWRPAADRVRTEVREMQAIADHEGAGIRIAPWDYRFYLEKVRKEKYDLDLQEVRPYLQLDRLREGLFWSAGRLYSLRFAPARVPVPHPDVTAWAVRDARGRAVGLWYFDLFARSGKQSGAWMSTYRRQSDLSLDPRERMRSRGDRPVLPIVSLNANFIKPAPGEPVLLSWNDGATLFHEFGHGLHGLLSRVHYPSLSGTDVSWDFVEFPSQLNEHFLQTPEVLERFARHWRTGEPLPPELAAKIRRAATFGQGFQTLEYLASAILDLDLHLAPDRELSLDSGGRTRSPEDPDAFERAERARLGMPAEVALRHRPTQFSHIFAGEGYAAGYYSYLWADALTADAWEAFQGPGGPFAGAVARRFRRTILQVGNTVDPAQAWRAFRGRDVDPSALMRQRGFAPEGGPPRAPLPPLAQGGAPGGAASGR